MRVVVGTETQKTAVSANKEVVMRQIVVWFDGMDWAGYVDGPEFLLSPVVRYPQKEDLIKELKRMAKQSHKLTDADVRQIYWMGKNGVTHNHIAEAFNISTRTVRRILSGETHKRITGEFDVKSGNSAMV